MSVGDGMHGDSLPMSSKPLESLKQEIRGAQETAVRTAKYNGYLQACVDLRTYLDQYPHPDRFLICDLIDWICECDKRAQAHYEIRAVEDMNG